MPNISSLLPRVLAASLTALAVLGSVAWAQQPPPVRIRGTIESVDGANLMIKSREGADMKVRMTDNVAVFGVAKTEMSEIKPGSYIGVSAMPEPDGTQKALAVHIFPETQRGAAEGFRPWDLRAGSTMTNATVAETVEGTDGQNILVKYKDGEKKVVVPPDTPIVTFVRGRQVRTEAGRQDHHLRRREERRRHAGSQPRQCRPRRHYPADVTQGVIPGRCEASNPESEGFPDVQLHI